MTRTTRWSLALVLLLPALALTGACADPSACGHDDDPALALGLASTGDFTPNDDPAMMRALNPVSSTVGRTSAPKCWNDGAISSDPAGNAIQLCRPSIF